jgi:hypothetical protein
MCTLSIHMAYCPYLLIQVPTVNEEDGTLGTVYEI